MERASDVDADLRGGRAARLRLCCDEPAWVRHRHRDAGSVVDEALGTEPAARRTGEDDVAAREDVEGVLREGAAGDEDGDGDDAPDLLAQEAAPAHLDDDERLAGDVDELGRARAVESRPRRGGEGRQGAALQGGIGEVVPGALGPRGPFEGRLQTTERVADVAGGMVVPELQIFIGLALFAGIISGALFGPAVRIVRCYNTCVRPPSWGGDFVGVSKAVVPLLHASFALPIVTAFAWFAPLSRGPFGLTDEQYDLLRVVSLMVTGLVQVAVVPALVQAYLDGGMVAWYEVKHGEKGVQAMAALRGVVRQKLEVTRHLACKVALQAVGPATLMIAYACLLGCKRRDESDGATENITSLVPAVCWRTIASFLGWWTCAVWATLTSAGVAAAKAGVETFTR